MSKLLYHKSADGQYQETMNLHRYQEAIDMINIYLYIYLYIYHIEGAVFTTIWCSMYKVQSVDSRYLYIYIYIYIYICMYVHIRFYLVTPSETVPSMKMSYVID